MDNKPENQDLTKQQLVLELHLEMDKLDDYIVACRLNKDKNNYAPDEVALIQKYKDWVGEKADAIASFQSSLEKGNSVESALENLKPTDSTDSTEYIEPTDSTESKNEVQSPTQEQSTEPLLGMLQSAQELTGKPLTLSRATELLKVSGLSEKAAYTPSESQRFLATCDAVINQGAGMAEVAIKNGVKTDSLLPHLTGSTATIGATHLQEQMMDKAVDINEQILETYEQTYLNRVAQMFSSGELESAFRIKSEERRLKRGKSVFELECEKLRASNNYLTIEATPVEIPSIEGKTDPVESQSDF